MAAQPPVPQGPFFNWELPPSDTIGFQVDVESIVRQQIREVAQATDGAFRRILEEAYSAGWDARHGEDFHDPEGYVDALINRLKED